MPSGPRIRGNNCQGTVSDNPLTLGALTLNSAGLANLPAVASAHAVIILDPLRVAGAPEIVLVTAHTAGATSAPISRGAYGTTPRQHLLNTAWVHAPTIEDLIQILTSATRPSDPYRGQLIFETDTNSFVARDTSDAWQTAVMLGAWPAWTPTLTQSGAVTKTVSYAGLSRIGRTIIAEFNLAVTGAGTVTNSVLVGLPVAAAAAVVAGTAIGSGLIFDASTSTVYTGEWSINSTTTVLLNIDQASAAAWGVSPNLALASGDAVRGHLMFEAAA